MFYDVYPKEYSCVNDDFEPVSAWLKPGFRKIPAQGDMLMAHALVNERVVNRDRMLGDGRVEF